MFSETGKIVFGFNTGNQIQNKGQSIFDATTSFKTIVTTVTDTNTSLFGTKSIDTPGCLFSFSGNGNKSTMNDIFSIQKDKNTNPFGTSTTQQGTTISPFGQPPQLFQNTWPSSSTINLTNNSFSSPTTGFEATKTRAAMTGTIVKFNPVQKHKIHHCINLMKEYETKSLEELRFEDYKSGRNFGTFFGVNNQIAHHCLSVSKPLTGFNIIQNKPKIAHSCWTNSTPLTGSKTIQNTSFETFRLAQPNKNIGPNLFDPLKPFLTFPVATTNNLYSTLCQTSTTNTLTSSGQTTGFPSRIPETTTDLRTNTYSNLNSGLSLLNQQKFEINSGTSNSLDTSKLPSIGEVGSNQFQQNVASNSIHQHILALVSATYGTSPLLKNLPILEKSEKIVNITNRPINSSQYEVFTNGYSRIKPRIDTSFYENKMSLFQELEDEDSSLLEVFQPRSKAKRLVLRPGTVNTP